MYQLESNLNYEYKERETFSFNCFVSLNKMILPDLVIGLLEGLNDKNQEVQESISASLVELGKKKVKFILTTIHGFMRKNITKVCKRLEI